MPLIIGFADRTRTELRLSEGNFGGNRLLDGSISLSPLYPESDERFARRYRLRASTSFLRPPRSGIVHHLSGPTGMLTLEPFSKGLGRSAVQPLRDPANRLPCALRVYSPLTRTHVGLLGRVSRRANGNPARGEREHAECGGTPNGARFSPRSRQRRLHGHNNNRALAPPNPRRSTPESIGGPGSSPVRIRPEAHRRPPSASLPDNFKHSLTLFSNLGRNSADWGCIPKQPDSMTAPRGATGSSTTGLSPSLAPLSGDLNRSVGEDASTDYNSNDVAVRFSSLGSSGSLAVTKGI
ncbi:hypothetical protein Syun_006800 [Stephania yunnanensis]|uniref:Uncharacterized protein n=1 Tax=Stephania yunnanensis TaxID=152371 RepID=A0AAP0KYZ6_9MAGN